VYESRPLPYAEDGYGYPEAGQTVVNVTNAKLIRLLLDDQPFDVRSGELRTMSDRSTSARASWNDMSSGCRRAALGPGALGAPGVAGPALGGRDRLRDRTIGGPLRVVVQSELVATRSFRRPAGTLVASRARSAAVLGVPRMR